MFIVSYAGNIGYAQGLDVLLDAADLLRMDTDILVMFIGDGVARRQLMDIARARQLTNVRFIEHQPVARVPEIYAASDLCIVPLLDSIGADAIPSKVYRIMACSRPILAIASSSSESRRSGARVGAAASWSARMPRQSPKQFEIMRRCRSVTAVSLARPVVATPQALSRATWLHDSTAS